MPSPAPSTSLYILVIVIAMIIWWRATIIIVGALVIAVLVVGVHEVVDYIDQPSAREIITWPPADLPLP